MWLLDHGMDADARAAVDALEWGERFQYRMVVSEPAMRLIREKADRPER